MAKSGQAAPTGRQRRPDHGLSPAARQQLQAALQLHGAGQLDGAVQLYQAILQAHPEHPPTLNFIGLVYHQAGQAAAALGWVERAIAADARDPSFHLCHAHVLAALGRTDEAVAACRRSLTLSPNHTEALNQIALLLIGQGERAEARSYLERACRIEPNNAASRANLGELLRQLGELDAALAACRAAVRLQPQLAEAHLLLGNVLKERGDLEEACASYDRALAINPGLANAHHNGATARRALGLKREALDGFRAALDLEPGSIDHKTAVAACLVELPDGPFDARSHADLTRALREGWARPESLAVSAATCLKQDSDIGMLLAWAARQPDDVLPVLPAGTPIDAMLDEPLLCALLETSVVVDPAIECLLTRLRALLLAQVGEPGAMGAARLEFAAGLAIQCFDGDYVLAESSAEAERVAALAVEIEATLAAGGRPSTAALLALASYRALHRLPGAARLPAEPAPLERVLRHQIAEPLEEARLRDTIPAFGTISDPVSQAVRAQYEENPYPRWTRMPVSGAALPLRIGLAAEFPQLRASFESYPERPSILIAGCGTGWHSIATARSYPEASVLAVDLSRASLGYALRKTRELGVGTIEYRQADILSLGALDRRFELIDSGGVLHHMADPIAGWRVLCSLLQPAGIMRISLYSALARRSVVAARDVIARHGFAPDPAGIRAARAALRAELPADDLVRLERSPDFYSLSGCRDLLFHVQEHCFTLPQIAEALSTLGLELLGLNHVDPTVPARYAAAYPGDPGMTDLASWAAFEAANPDLFSSMYSLNLRRRP